MHASPWMDGAREPGTPLVHDAVADVAVVGAGLTGLSAALGARELGVVVLGREIAGFGASVRGAGHLAPTIGKDPAALARLFGQQRGRALAALVQDTVAHVAHTIAEQGTDCAERPSAT